MAQTLLIVNPRASAVTPERVETVKAELERATDLELVWTERRGHATELARESDAEAIIVFSGDGGFNEVLNGARSDVPVGFVPGGGSSVLPRALGLPRDPVVACARLVESIRSGRTRRISIGRVNGRGFGFAAALGFPAEIVRRIDELGRENGRRPPDRAFALTIGRELLARRGRIEPILEVDGGRVSFALVANGSPYTYFTRIPLRFAPEADFAGGLDLVAPLDVRARTIPRLLAAAALGRRAGGVLYRHDVDRLVISSPEPVALQVDGEDLGDVDHAVFEAARGALTLLA
ncbi:MAG TPA: diacylglycerol kinase family protein [Gaiellaceae bacterium]|jgi:diacylglycerol kinase family enzyme|nr:diacylglycerol kinase family protein [Gaiellaceae bacterium]